MGGCSKSDRAREERETEHGRGGATVGALSSALSSSADRVSVSKEAERQASRQSLIGISPPGSPAFAHGAPPIIGDDQ